MLPSPSSTNESPEITHPPYSLTSIQPIHGRELFRLSRKITKNIAFYLPRNTRLDEISDLLLTEPAVGELKPDNGEKRQRKENVEVEEEWMGNKLKALTCYFGGLVDRQEDFFWYVSVTFLQLISTSSLIDSNQISEWGKATIKAILPNADRNMTWWERTSILTAGLFKRDSPLRILDCICRSPIVAIWSLKSMGTPSDSVNHEKHVQHHSRFKLRHYAMPREWSIDLLFQGRPWQWQIVLTIR